jgi:glutamyl-tRNA synthetase
MGPWVHPIRVAVSGRTEGPGLFEMLGLLGKERTLRRLESAAEKYAL